MTFTGNLQDRECAGFATVLAGSLTPSVSQIKANTGWSKTTAGTKRDEIQRRLVI
jgi:hypothetical protein